MSRAAAPPAATPVGLVERLRTLAGEAPLRPLYTFLDEDGNEQDRLTYGELDRRARALAARLQALDAVGERALLLLPPGLDFVVAFFACLFAGVIAVPTPPPGSGRRLERLRPLVDDARPRLVLAAPAALEGGAGRRLAALPGLVDIVPERWLGVAGGGPSDEAAAWRSPTRRDDAIAFLQYTSGSTSAPKGVEVSHRNLAFMEGLIAGAFAQDAESVVVGWLPPYHDMGLIGTLLQPLHLGAACVLMAPGTFLRRPRRWLEAITRYRATTSGGPNFAYELCVERIASEDRRGLDLASWRVAFNGAEPVRAATLERFAAAFGPCGFRRSAFQPCYGLAEATLLVSGARAGSGGPTVLEVSAAALEAGRVEAIESAEPAEPIEPAEPAEPADLPGSRDRGRTLVGCGRVPPEVVVAVVDPATGERCLPGRVGEIWVAGPGVAGGYWQRPDETRATFQSWPAPTPADGGFGGPYLRTGDLGFLRLDELFVCGRLKDLVILRGRNLYPQDIELTAEASLPGAVAGGAAGAAAFSVEAAGEECLVVAVELAPRALRATDADEAEIESWSAAVRQAVAAEHEAQVYEVLLLRAGSLPRTSSGKVRRRACRLAYEAGTLESLGHSRVDRKDRGDRGARGDRSAAAPPPVLDHRQLLALPPAERSAALVADLAQRAAAALGAPAGALAGERPWISQGLDSLAAVELVHAIETAYGVPLSPIVLLDGAGAADLAKLILAGLDVAPAAKVAATAAEGEGDGSRSLSQGQRGLWFLDRLHSGDAAYHLVAAASVHGDLRVPALRAAFESLAERHDALRTTYVERDGEPLRRLSASVVEITEAIDVSAAELAIAAYRPFDLERGPLVRVMVWQRREGDAWLLFAAHHLVADFWSLGLLVRELSTLLRGETLPPRAPSYGAFVDWQRRRLAGPAGERLAAYWDRQLSGLPDLDLPFDRPPAIPATAGTAGNAGTAASSPAAVVGADLAPVLRERLGGFARQQGTTLFGVLLAGYQALLGRHTGQTDLAVGSPLAGRPADLPGAGEIFGYMVNPAVLRGDLSGDPDFRTLLERSRLTLLAALEHQDYPLPLLAERLRGRRGDLPLIRALLVFHRPPAELPALASFALGEAGGCLRLPDGAGGEVELESLPMAPRAAQFELSLACGERYGGVGGVDGIGGIGGLRMALTYRSDLFDAVTARRLLGHLVNLLAAAAEQPGMPLAALPILDAGERHQLLVEWPPGFAAAEAAPWETLHAAIGGRAALTPEAVALLASDATLSYAELWRRSGALAQRLRGLGAGPETVVGICLPRTADLVVAMLAVLRSGASYLPLDPSHPAERLALMLEDAAAAVLITRQDFWADRATTRARRLDPGGAAAPTLGEAIGIDTADAADAIDAIDAIGTLGANLAYLIYTSGSTGRPKAVAITHHSAVRLVAWANDAFTREELAGVLAATSVGFDLSVFEIFVPLALGGTVVLAENALALPGLAAAPAVTLINTVPAALAALLDLGPLPARLRTVCLAGEPLPRALAERLHAAQPGVRLLNLYGPSEDTTYSTGAEVPTGDPRPPAIGRAVAGARTYVLDPTLSPTPHGVPGELCLGGEGLARGYLGRPELTAERFVPDPFATAGARLYRTGDRARHRADGELEYLSRLDRQVKLRGFRLEPGEIEATLRTHPTVRDAAVVLRREDEPPRLVAYIVPAPAGIVAEGSLAGAEEALRAYLAARLPAPLVPAAFVVLPALPRNPNGKLDRAALPVPERTASAARRPPQGIQEERLALLWQTLLGAGEIGRDDNFFVLGGHSLLAARLVARVREAFGVDLPLAAPFAAPTLAALAGRIAALLAPAADQSPIRRAPRRGPLPLSAAQRRFWLLDQMAPGQSAYNMPLVVRFAGPLDRAALAAALVAVVARHEALRTVFRVVGGIPEQCVVPADAELPANAELPADAEPANAELPADAEPANAELPANADLPAAGAMPCIDLAALPAGRRRPVADRLAAAEAARPFDLERGPLLRARLLVLGPAEHRLVLVVHHAAGDVWSLGLVLRDLGAAYGLRRARVPAAPLSPSSPSSPSSPPSLQYADYAVWENAQGEPPPEVAEEWRRRLADVPPLELPLDRPRPAVWDPRGAQQRGRISAALFTAMRGLARRQGASPFMVLAAAFAALLRRLGGQRDLAIGTASGVRERPELAEVVGCFVDTLVLRFALADNDSFVQRIERARAALLAAYDHRGLSFDRLVEAVSPRRDPARPPLVQALIALQGLPPELVEPRFAGLEAEVSPLASGAAQLEISWALRETADGGLAGEIEYASRLFDAATVARFWSHLAVLLAAAVESPDTPADALPLLDAAGRHQLVSEWNDRPDPRDPGGPGDLIAAFMTQAAATPTAPALEAGALRLTYGELAAGVRHLARLLRRHGIGAESRVVLEARRAPEMVLAVLAVLAAGGVYVPLDPAAPVERRDQILRDAAPRLVLGWGGPPLAAYACAYRSLDGMASAAATDSTGATGEPPEGPGAEIDGAVVEIDGEHPAYVLYTSGSTGTPKGVIGRRRALSGYLAAAGEAYGLGAGDRLLQFSALGFDTSAEELLCGLLRGATLVLRDDAMLASSADFFAACDRMRITVLDLPTAYWHELSAHLASVPDAPGAGGAGATVPATLRLVIVGGEAMRRPAAAPWLRRGGLRLLNSYGPTEATIGATLLEVTGPRLERLQRHEREIPVGRPCGEAIAHVAPSGAGDGAPAPIGVAGELLLGGEGLARGYCGRPDLTAERFLPDPWGGQPGARLYRTGDRARRLPGGEIELIGRLDSQVKVRGYRVELGDIEAALARHPRVAAAAVLLRPAADGGLVAYVAPHPSPGQPHAALPDEAELRRFLRAQLPEYMVPTRCVVLAELPLTLHGKVDHRRLPAAPPLAAAASASAPSNPRTPPAAAADPVVASVAAIWAEVLGRADIGPDDDFFELGGHSLLAAQVVARLREHFAVELPLLALFEAPTVAALAARVAGADRPAPAGQVAAAAGAAAADGAEPGGVTIAPLAFSQERLWFLDRLQSGSAFYNLAGAVRLRGKLDAWALRASLDDVVRRHGALRTTFRQRHGVAEQVIAPTCRECRDRREPRPFSRLRLPEVDLSPLPAARRAALARDLATAWGRQPFDLERGPLLAVVFLRLDAEQGALALAVHHIVADGWSLSLLTGELAAGYARLAAGEAPGLPEPPQFAAFARHQRSAPEEQRLALQIEAWRGRLAGLTPCELPLDRPRPAQQTFAGATLTAALPPAVVAALAALGRRQGATLFMALLAAWDTLVYRVTGRTDVAVGTDVALRDRLDSELVIGFFVNSLVLRTDLSGNPSFRQLLARVRATALGAYAIQDAPFHRVVEAVRPPRDPSRNPLFQLMFILQNAPPLRFRLPGLAVEPLPLAEGASVFDLSVSWEEDGEGGLSGTFRYNTDLFAAATVHRWAKRFVTLVTDAAARPDTRLDALAIESADERERKTMESKTRKNLRFDKLAAARPQAVTLSQESLVRISPLVEGQALPLLVEPAAAGTDVDAVAWAAGHRDAIRAHLARHGGVLFRGFHLAGLGEFQALIAALSAAPIRYGERSSPRSQLEGEVYTSTDHPADQPIVMHNEQSYTLNWPMKIAFFCVQPAASGGATPVADSRAIYRRLSAPVREAFERRQVMYVRNYGDGLGLPWRDVFQTSDRAEVERYCREAGITVEWKDGGDRLRTRQVRPAVRLHPWTGEPVWFNHAMFFHVSSLEPATRDALLGGLAADELPFHSLYGDGGEIEAAALDEVRAAFAAETVTFPWQRGDVLLLDNMMVAHGREPFSGPRKIAVAMSEPITEVTESAGAAAADAAATDAAAGETR